VTHGISAIDLYFYRARYFDPLAGRFLSEDPLGFDRELNFYRFFHNNPVQVRKLGLADDLP